MKKLLALIGALFFIHMIDMDQAPRKTVNKTITTNFITCSTSVSAKTILRALQRYGKETAAFSYMLYNTVGECTARLETASLQKVILDLPMGYVYLAKIHGETAFIPTHLDFTDD